MIKKFFALLLIFKTSFTSHIDGTVTKFFLKYHEQTLGEKVQQELLEVIKKSEIDIVVKDTDESTTMEKMAQKFFDRENSAEIGINPNVLIHQTKWL